ncbi:thioredoxin O2, mitochondrial isoform X1 [Brassica napus]|uniref:thioredoxin O2, mitochondrial isoform X1 n=1 Tax=Brassica napus TaxID=3708 RepID=UPI0020791AFD|nr:thioredoxin O2, mitochondrial isoform X1 [Brassica napus]
MKSDWFNLHQIARNSFIATSTVYASTELNFDRRSFCFFAPDRSGFVVLKSEKEFNNALSKARDGSLPSVFYFTAAWCGPCKFIYFSETKFRFWMGFLLMCDLLGRLIAPVMLELGKKYPHVTTYKVDIDEGGLSNALGKLNVSAVPTMQFFKGGVKKAELVGADVIKLRSIMEHLYK